MAQYPPFLFLLCNYGEVVFGFWIPSTSLSGYAKVCCNCINGYLLEWDEWQHHYLYYLYHFLKDLVYGVHQGRYHSNPPISIFRSTVGCIKRLQKCGFWWYQVSIVNGPYHICSENWNEFVLTIELKEPLDTHEQIVCNSWSIFQYLSQDFLV